MPPRTAYSPTSRTVAVRSKPFASSQRVSCSIGIDVARGDRHRALRDAPLSGTRWTMALAVVKTTRGPLCGSKQRVQRAHPLGRDLGVGRHAVVGKAVPGRETSASECRGRRRRAPPRRALRARASRATKRTVPSLSAIRASTRPSSPSGTPPSVRLCAAGENVRTADRSAKTVQVWSWRGRAARAWNATIELRRRVLWR